MKGIFALSIFIIGQGLFAVAPQWEGDYVLLKETAGCPEGALILKKERVLLGSRLSFELTPGVINSREEECQYAVKTDMQKDGALLKITRMTERTNCKTKQFEGKSEETLTVKDGTAEYILMNSSEGEAKSEELKCLYKKD